jgi:hypothetical protein
MPKNLQIFLFKKRFGVNDTIDWDAIVDETLTFPENLRNIETDHLYEIESAQHQLGMKTESEKKVELEAELLAKHDEDMMREQAESILEAEPEEAIVEEDTGSVESNGWQIEQTEDGETHSIEIEIEPHQVTAKGREYLYGRIQLSLDPKFIGLIARVIVAVPKELL